jgi:hypothetical protein
MTDTITLTNPTTGETWTSGKRGRRPSWVKDLEAAGTVIPKKIVATAAKKVDADAIPGALRVWRFVGQAGETGDNDKTQQLGHCLIIAQDPAAAITVANPTFKYPISNAEFALLWSEETDTGMLSEIHKSGVDITKTAVWHGTPRGWEQRKRLLTSVAG